MAKDRFVGRGALVSVENGNTYTSVGLCRSITPPPEEKSVIDMTGMEDATFVGDVGIEGQSLMNFSLITDPVDAGEALLDTLYASGNTANIRVTTISGAKTWTKTFPGKVVSLSPDSFGGSDPVTRTVGILRTGAIVDNVS